MEGGKIKSSGESKPVRIVTRMLLVDPVVNRSVECIRPITLPFENVDFARLFDSVADVLSPGVLRGDEPESGPGPHHRVPLHATFKVPISPGFPLSSVVREGRDGGV